MSVKVKICGITTLKDALFAVEADADAVGFIFYKKSSRYIEPRRAAEIVKKLPPFVTSVGVFVDETAPNINKFVNLVGLGCVQLHGDEPPELCRSVEANVVKALRVGEGFEVETLKGYGSVVSAILLDTHKEGLKGGTGETFDWNLALKAKECGRIILSGGLTPANVRSGIKLVRPYGVDVSSGVESAPGKKDYEKIKEFMKEVRSVDG